MLGVVLIIVTLVITQKLSKKRSALLQGLKDFARLNNFSFDEDGSEYNTSIILPKPSFLNLVGSVRYLMKRKTDSYEIQILNYSVSRRNRHGDNYTIVIFKTNTTKIPEFEVNSPQLSLNIAGVFKKSLSQGEAVFKGNDNVLF
ncbi:MAG: hypothetical protein ABII27_01160 [bacterium]